MAVEYNVRVLVRLIFYFLFSLCHSNLDFFVIFMFKYDFIKIFSMHIPLWSAEDVYQEGHSFTSQRNCRRIEQTVGRLLKRRASVVPILVSLKTASEIEMFLYM